MSRFTGDGGVVTAMKEPKPAKKKAWHSTVAWKSDKRVARKPLEERMLARLLERDGGCVVAGELWIDGPHECSGPLVLHHRRKASAGGGYTERCLVVTCSQANLDIENEPAFVRSAYPWLVVREGDREWDELGAQR